MKAHNFLAGLLMVGILAMSLFMIGCEGKEGPAGPQGPEGPQGPPGQDGEDGTVGDGPTYLGNSASSCGHCHSATTSQWMGTHHAAAFDNLDAESQSNPYCIQCHTTGFDDVFDHDGNLIAEGLDQRGYDDEPRDATKGVGCESCHGPLGPALTHTPDVDGGLTGETCDRCHDQNEEWAETRHAMTKENAGGQEAFFAEWGRSSCWACHISEGYIAAVDPDWTGVVPTVTMANSITCVTCHDPHNPQNEFYLRDLGPADLPTGGGEDGTAAYQITGWGSGQTCAQCHHSRRSASNIQGQIDNGSEHPGPHESPQADMIAGTGCYEIPGFDYADVRGEMLHSTSILEDVCVSCHMPTIARGQEGGPYFGHEFEPKLFKCQTCHGSATSFDIGGVQTEVADLLEQLGALLPQEDGHVMEAMDTLSWTRPQREAGYAYYFVEADGSHGVHNPEYAIRILTNAINNLTAAMAEEKRTGVRG